jgi:ATP-dependent DNA helicase RecG
MKALKLKDRVNFAKNYIEPALSAGFVEMTEPDSPKSPTQKYRLTEKGRKLLEN